MNCLNHPPACGLVDNFPFLSKLPTMPTGSTTTATMTISFSIVKVHGQLFEGQMVNFSNANTNLI